MDLRSMCRTDAVNVNRVTSSPITGRRSNRNFPHIAACDTCRSEQRQPLDEVGPRGSITQAANSNKATNQSRPLQAERVNETGERSRDRVGRVS